MWRSTSNWHFTRRGKRVVAKDKRGCSNMRERGRRCWLEFVSASRFRLANPPSEQREHFCIAHDPRHLCLRWRCAAAHEHLFEELERAAFHLVKYRLAQFFGSAHQF